MKLYREVLIESAEQAEALPIGTLARHSSGPGMDHAHKAQGLSMQLWVSYAGNLTNSSMVGFVALVPVEAEEEFQDIDAYEASGHMRRHHLARYTTPWEEAS